MANSVFFEQVKATMAVRRDAGPANNAEDTFHTPELNNRRDLLVAQALPSKTELTRLGGSWATRMLTAVAAVTSLPTTAAQHLMRNGNAAGGKSFVIDKIIYHVAAAPTDTDGSGVSVLASVIPVQAAVTAAQAVIVNSLSGWGAYNGNATFDDANTLAADKGWFELPMVCSSPMPTWTARTTLFADIDGGIIIPPGGGLAISAFAIDTSLTGFPAFIWHEVVLPINE